MLYSLRINDKRQVKNVKQTLESVQILCKDRKIKTFSDGSFGIPVKTGDAKLLSESVGHLVPIDIVQDEDSSSKKLTTASLARDFGLSEDQIAAVSRWVVYPPMLLFPSCTADLTLVQQEFWSLLLSHSVHLFQCKQVLTHVAQNNPIVDKLDIVRIPSQIKRLYGDFGPTPTAELRQNPSARDFANAFWCSASQNGIHQVWAPMYTMFSRGNIKEKARVLKFDNIADSTVIDLYSGIGYFCFSYAQNRPKHVFCWEINPWSIEGLVRGANANKFRTVVVQHNEQYVYNPEDCIVIFMEDNQHAVARMSELVDRIPPISHINMGLLPDCRLAWPIAKQLATLTRGTTCLHVHENVAVTDIDQWKETVAQSLGSLPCSHVEHIKTYAPGVMHVCGDFKLTD